MSEAARVPSLPSLDVAPPDLAAPVVYLPVRHHSPACAFHVDRVIRAIRPASVLIEGPRDATALVRHLVDARTRPPIAIYTTFVDRREEGLPNRFGAYYPLCEYSPEWVALQAAHAVGADARFVDLTYPEMVRAETAATQDHEAPATVRSLQDEAFLQRSQLLRVACREAGARDPDDLWDCLFEHDFRQRESASFFHGVLTWCALARRDYTPEMIAAEAHDVREAAMRVEIDAALAAGGGRPIVVVTGGFHTVALPTTAPRRPGAVKLARPEDAGVTLIRYGFVQLDRLNGYASGMPSPEFYQRLWEARDPAELLVEIARELRQAHSTPSTAEVTAALHQVQALASFRGHALPTREDLLDGVRSAFVKGSVDIEGVAVLAQARKCLAGSRRGEIAPDAGRPPLVLDFECTAQLERLALDHDGDRDVTLDLYRSVGARARSRFFYRLRLLDVPFARMVRGPDYVAGRHLERVTEAWRYCWQPATEAALIEQSRYGATLEEAATSLLLERFEAAERAGQRSDLAARLLLEACRCGLHVQAPSLLARTDNLVAADPTFSSVVAAAADLDLLRQSREPLEAHDLPGLDELVGRAWERAASLVATLAVTAEPAESKALDDLCTWSALALAHADQELATLLRRESLESLAGQVGANPTIIGCATGLLYGDGVVSGETVGRRLAGFLEAADATLGARFLRGLLRSARASCWLEPTIVDAVHRTLADLEEHAFVAALPHLRLAYSDLTPRECDLVAAASAARCGRAAPVTTTTVTATEQDLLLGTRANALVGELLAQWGRNVDE
jgi:hypothetical protein